MHPEYCIILQANDPPETRQTFDRLISDRDAFSAKFWLDSVALAYNLGFPARELRKLEELTTENQKELLEAWNEYFGT